MQRKWGMNTPLPAHDQLLMLPSPPLIRVVWWLFPFNLMCLIVLLVCPWPYCSRNSVRLPASPLCIFSVVNRDVHCVSVSIRDNSNATELSPTRAPWGSSATVCAPTFQINKYEIQNQLAVHGSKLHSITVPSLLNKPLATHYHLCAFRSSIVIGYYCHWMVCCAL